jgi:hypothetical protein
MIDTLFREFVGFGALVPSTGLAAIGQAGQFSAPWAIFEAVFQLAVD